MMKRLMSAAFLVAAMALLPGCPDDPADGNNTNGNNNNNAEPEIKIDELCKYIDGSFEKYMAWEFGRCGMYNSLTATDVDHLNAYDPIGWGSYVAITVGEQKLNVTCAKDFKDDSDFLIASVKAGKVAFDQAKLKACVKAGQDAKAAGNVGAPVADVCGEIFAPAVAVGGACDHNIDCKDGSYCRPTDAKAGCGGVCTMPLAAGTPCDGYYDVCAADTNCEDPDATDEDSAKKCVQLPKVNEPCRDDSPSCGPNLWCDTSGGDPGTCTAKKAAGSDCSSSTECQSGLTCNDEDKCAEPPGYALEGQDCGPAAGDIECDWSKCLICGGGDETTPGKCTKLRSAGQECFDYFYVDDNGDGQTFKACDSYSLSLCDEDTNKCVLRPRAGEKCKAMDESKLGSTQMGDCMYMDNFCKRADDTSVEGTCAPLPGLGEECADAPDKSKYCAGTLTCDPETSKCVKGKALGEECTEYGECESPNECLDLDGSGTYKCAAYPAAGQPCGLDPDDDTYCADGAYCDSESEKCVALKAGGEVCTANGQCAGGLCTLPSIDAEDKVCMSMCSTEGEGDGCFTGFGMMTQYIFVSGTLVFLATRRRRQAKK